MTTQQANKQTTSTELTTFDMDFGVNDEVVKPTKQLHPQLRYMTGNLSTTTMETAVGWYVAAGVNPALDEFLAARGTKRCIVNHVNGDEKEKPYWNLSASGEPLSLFIIATGVKSTYEMNKTPEDRNGIAYGLGHSYEEDGTPTLDPMTGEPKRKVYMQLRVFIDNFLEREHPEQGFNDFFELTLTNYMVDALYAVLNAQFSVIDTFNGLAKAKGSANRAQFWSFSIPTLIGQRTEVKKSQKKKDAGNGTKKEDDKKQQSSFIYPMVPVIPQFSDTNEAVAYLNVHRIPQNLQEVIRDGLLEETIAWSVKRSLEIIEGKRDQAPTTTIMEEPMDAAAVELPQLPAGNDPRVTKEEADWIRDTYCAGDQEGVKGICVFYGVSVLAQLKKSQYDALYLQFTNA